MPKRKANNLVPVTAAGRTIRKAYRQEVTSGAWREIFRGLVAQAKQGDTKSIELLVKLGGAGVPTHLTQNNFYYGDSQGPPPGTRNGKPTGTLPGTTGKIQEMRRRASRGESLQSPADAARNGD